jgi:hypothetical protein
MELQVVNLFISSNPFYLHIKVFKRDFSSARTQMVLNFPSISHFMSGRTKESFPNIINLARKKCIKDM